MFSSILTFSLGIFLIVEARANVTISPSSEASGDSELSDVTGPIYHESSGHVPEIEFSVNEDLPNAISDTNSLPKPRIILVGETGVGKSSLANVLSFGDLRCRRNCSFPVCPKKLDSCTNETNFQTGNWLGDPQNPMVTIVDTPGFGDSSGSQGEDTQNKLIAEMMDVLNNQIKTCGAIVLSIKGTESFNRIDASMHRMLQQLEALFGISVWDKLVINIGWFGYSQVDKIKRDNDCRDCPECCRNEDFFINEISNVLKREYGKSIKGDLRFTFIDSHADLSDFNQQGPFETNTNLLLNYSMSGEEFVLQTVDDVLQQNTQLRRDLDIEKAAHNVTKQEQEVAKEQLSTLEGNFNEINANYTALQGTKDELEVAKDKLVSQEANLEDLRSSNKVLQASLENIKQLSKQECESRIAVLGFNVDA